MTVTTRQTNIQVSEQKTFDTCLIDESLDYTISRDFVKDELPYGVDLYMRVRYQDPTHGDSEWSPSVQFQVIIPASIIGVCMDNSTTKGTFSWIDACGNKLDSFDYKNHPTYANITTVYTDISRDSVQLTRFPLFYVKTAASGPVGSFAAGKKCWWISDIPQKGFRPAACFKRTTSKSEGKYIISNYCYMGTYLGHQTTAGGKTVIGSAAGQTVVVSQTRSTFLTWISNRNNASAGQSGWRMFDIWDMGALRILALIAKANADTQTVWGSNSAQVTTPKSGSTNARIIFNSSNVSMEDMWSCYWYDSTGIRITKGVVNLFSPMDSTALSFGSAAASRYTTPTTTCWIRDVLDCPFVIGDDTHDLMELFLNKNGVSSEAQATFCDVHDVTGDGEDDYFPAFGGPPSATAYDIGGLGLFHSNDMSKTLSGGQRSCRICKS